MSSEDRNYTAEIRCSHCHRDFPFEILGSVDDFHEQSDDYGPPYMVGTEYAVLRCVGCKSEVLGKRFRHEILDDEEGPGEYKIVLSGNALLPEGLPNHISTAYEAALRVRGIDVNAYAVLLGRVLELVCKDRNANGETLNDQLDWLCKNDEIPKRLVTVARQLRQLRNIGAHPEAGELTAREIPILSDLCRALLEYVYSAPLLVEKAENRLKRAKARRD